MFAACGNFSGPIAIIPRTPVAPTEKLGQPCLRDDFCEPPFATLWASFGSAAKRRNTEDDNIYLLDKRLREGTPLPKLYFAIGSEDPGAQEGYDCMDLMTHMGLEMTQVRDEGKHDWVYCNRHIQKFLDWIPLHREYIMEDQ